MSIHMAPDGPAAWAFKILKSECNAAMSGGFSGYRARIMGRMSRAEDFPADGGCTCGAVRYRLLRSPLFVNACHCRWCQRESGSAFALNAMIEADQVQLLAGEPERVNTPSNSGKGQVYRRCPTCRIALWSHYAGAGDAVSFVRVGTLDAPDIAPPDIHIFTLSKQPWLQLPDGTPAVPEYYDRRQYWPAESLARRASMLAVQPSKS
jgi:hypothetical protein